MKKTALVFLIVMAMAVPAMAWDTFIPGNSNMYAWQDPYGDQFDQSMTVKQGETVRIGLKMNQIGLGGWHWSWEATGIWMEIAWEPGVLVPGQVIEDGGNGMDNNFDGVIDAADQAITDLTVKNYMWATGHNNLNGATEWWRWMDGGSLWMANGRTMYFLTFTIAEDAPLGVTTIGWESRVNDTSPDPLAEPGQMTMVVPIGDPYAFELIIQAANIPEPMTMSLLAIGAVGLLRRRRS